MPHTLSQRKRELRVRRHRKKKLAIFARKLKTATASDKVNIAAKIRNLTPGSEDVLANFGLTDV